MDIRLDSRLPLVWRDPRTLQVGVDRPVAVIDGVTSRHERIIAAIAAGHGRSGVGSVAQRAGCRDAEVSELVEKLRPALLPRDPAVVATIHVAGSTALADEIHSLFASTGTPTRRVDGDQAGTGPVPTLGVAVAEHVHDPVLAGAWLRRDVPHLSVVTGDVATRVGPVVVPGVTACAHCLDLHRADVDGAWGVIAGQLWGRPSVGQPLLATHEAAVSVVRRVMARLAGDPARAPDPLVESIDAATGIVTTATTTPHLRCGCAALPRIGSADGRSDLALGPGGSTRGEDVAVPA